MNRIGIHATITVILAVLIVAALWMIPSRAPDRPTTPQEVVDLLNQEVARQEEAVRRNTEANQAWMSSLEKAEIALKDARTQDTQLRKQAVELEDAMEDSEPAVVPEPAIEDTSSYPNGEDLMRRAEAALKDWRVTEALIYFDLLARGRFSESDLPTRDAMQNSAKEQMASITPKDEPYRMDVHRYVRQQFMASLGLLRIGDREAALASARELRQRVPDYAPLKNWISDLQTVPDFAPDLSALADAHARVWAWPEDAELTEERWIPAADSLTVPTIDSWLRGFRDE